MNISDHFVIDNRRLLLCLDGNAEPISASYWLHGREYAKRGMWAIAALHFRHSLALEERLEAYMQLAVAYLNLGYDDMAERTMVDAQRFSPGHPQLLQLAAMIAEARSRSK